MANRYTDEQRQAVVDDVVKGIPIREVARTHGVAPTTVQVWAQGARSAAFNTLNKDTLGQGVLTYVSENLETLSAQARYFRSDAFLQTKARGNAEGLGILHGILADKVVRLYVAIAGTEQADA